jgi:elongation factor P
MYSTQDFRNGLKIEVDGEPFEIVEFQHVKPGKGNAFTRTKIKSLLTGRVLDPTFKSGDRVGKPDVEDRSLQYLYKDGEHFVFMDNTTYEQSMIEADVLGGSVRWLTENCDCQVLFWNGRAIGVQLPTFVVLKIVECEPGVRGDTATGATKPATLETGGSVQVPLFVNEGERIRIDTRTNSYVERA